MQRSPARMLASAPHTARRKQRRIAMREESKVGILFRENCSVAEVIAHERLPFLIIF